MHTICRFLASTLLSVIVALAVTSSSPAGADLAPPPTPPPVSGSLTPSCIDEVPVPMISATVVNHTEHTVPVALAHDGIHIATIQGGPQATTHLHLPNVAWEDRDNHFELVHLGEVLASLDHHFDCLHPIIEIDEFTACSDQPIEMTVANSGAEGTHVDVTLDGAIVASPPVAPGHQATVELTADEGQLLEVWHQGLVMVAAVAHACDDPPAQPPVPDPPAADPPAANPAGDDPDRRLRPMEASGDEPARHAVAAAEEPSTTGHRGHAMALVLSGGAGLAATRAMRRAGR